MQAMEDRGLIVKTSAYIDRHRDEMLSLWEKIVSIESEPRIKRALTG